MNAYQVEILEEMRAERLADKVEAILSKHPWWDRNLIEFVHPIQLFWLRELHDATGGAR